MSWLSLIPPLLAISIALFKRDVIVALLLAIFSAELILAGGHPLQALLQCIERLVSAVSTPDNSRILMFSLLIGALLAWFRLSGGVSAFVRLLLASGVARHQRSVGLLTWALGVLIFIESNLSILASGTFARSLFDRFHMSRARLALLVDATCAPVSVLILLNGWGAFILGLLAAHPLDNPLGTMLAAIGLNFYALGILAVAFYTAWSGRVHGPLAHHEAMPFEAEDPVEDSSQGKASWFLVPLLTLVLGIGLFMMLTGEGNPVQGDGARSVLYAMVCALLVCYALLKRGRAADHQTLLSQAFIGMGELLPIVSILLLAFALGAAMGELQTGIFLASLLPQGLPLWLLAPAVFLIACLMSFTTGTSWGTFGILIPVAIPLALSTGAPPSLLLAAVLGGGVFGDHCSPVSDSTVLASLASGCDHALHVRTQLPYALWVGGISLLLFALTGLLQA